MQSVSGCHYYFKLKGDAVYTSMCLLNPRQHIDAVSSSNLLDLIFVNFNDLCITFTDSGIVKPDTYHPDLVIDFFRPLELVLIIVSIPTVNLHLGIAPCYITFS